jgi:hypothetical protein
MITSSTAEICDLAPAVIAIMDESGRQINFNNLKKFVTSLSAAIGALDSHL